MSQISLRDSPLVAAILGTAVTGLGHLYLRRWLRALGWLSVTVVVSALFVPESSIAAIASGTLTNPLAMLPIVLISAASALDAYLIAAVKRAKSAGQIPDGSKTDRTDATVACPTCGKDVDPDLGFCHWCTTEFEVVDDAELTQLDEHNTD